MNFTLLWKSMLKNKMEIGLISAKALILGTATAAALTAAPPATVSALGSSEKGTSGAAFLKIGPGARPAAMGEAFSAVEGDVH